MVFMNYQWVIVDVHRQVGLFFSAAMSVLVRTCNVHEFKGQVPW